VKSEGRVVRPFLGVRYIPITRDFANSENLKVTEGAYLSGDESNPAVVADSPAAKAGLKDGDIIVKLNDKSINQNNPLSSVVSSFKVGDKVTIEVVRGEETLKLEATLEEAK
jgi:2-alkenal reductase